MPVPADGRLRELNAVGVRVANKPKVVVRRKANKRLGLSSVCLCICESLKYKIN